MPRSACVATCAPSRRGWVRRARAGARPRRSPASRRTVAFEVWGRLLVMARVRVVPVIACVLVASAASATVLLPAEFREIVHGSQIIAHARIVDARPAWADGRRWIDTIVTAEVTSYLKGASEDRTVTFK